jgi:hypothetical protein
MLLPARSSRTGRAWDEILIRSSISHLTNHFPRLFHGGARPSNHGDAIVRHRRGARPSNHGGAIVRHRRGARPSNHGGAIVRHRRGARPSNHGGAYVRHRRGARPSNHGGAIVRHRRGARPSNHGGANVRHRRGARPSNHGGAIVRHRRGARPCAPTTPSLHSTMVTMACIHPTLFRGGWTPFLSFNCHRMGLLRMYARISDNSRSSRIMCS